MPTLESQTVQLTNFLLPWIGILISAIIAIMFKDWATSLAKGIKFKLSNAFNPGDVVLLDGEEAVIITIGVTKTVFEKVNDRGIVWRYVPNERLAFLKLEKVVRRDVHKNGSSEKKATLIS